jgi:hypothetical protein
MDNKNTPIFYYDEEKAKTSKSPIIIALTELQMAVLIEVIWKQHNDPNTTWCIDGLDIVHPDVMPKYKEKKFTHYVWVLSEDNVRDWLNVISKHRWHTEDVLEWSSTYHLVFDKRNRSSNSLQYILNEVVDDYVRSHGDPRPELNKKLVTEVTKQKMMSAKHCGRLPDNE